MTLRRMRSKPLLESCLTLRINMTKLVSTVLLGYLAVTILTAIFNLLYLIRCVYYGSAYKRNLANQSMRKNVYFQDGLLDLCKKANICVAQSVDINWLTRPEYKDGVFDTINRLKGRFAYRVLHSWKWVSFVKVSLHARPLFRALNKRFLALICFVISIACSYFLGLFLDKSGIGNEILNWIETSIGQGIRLVFQHSKE